MSPPSEYVEEAADLLPLLRRAAAETIARRCSSWDLAEAASRSTSATTSA